MSLKLSGRKGDRPWRKALAPCPPHIAHDPELRAIWSRQRHNICHWLKEADEHPYYCTLKPLLDAHAEQLAGAIDQGPTL
jgi:hypothetical protein